MKVPDEVRKCVVFLLVRTASGNRLAGTGFFTGVLVEGELHAFYLITARHVLDESRAYAMDGSILVRINTQQGGAALVETHRDQWFFHPDTTKYVDVAALFWAPPLETFDYRVFPRESISSRAELERMIGLGVGDEVFLPGLFVNHYGKERNIPIVRTGTIAALPEEPIDTDNGPMDAYLIEPRSMGGLSGSPVFVHLGGVREDPETGRYRMLANAQFRLIGLMHGHWRVIMPGPVPASVRDEAVNMGMGIVVPAEAILEVLDSPEQVRLREEAAERERQERLPVADTPAVVTPAEYQPRVTREEFIRDLTNVTRPVEESGQEPS